MYRLSKEKDIFADDNGKQHLSKIISKHKAEIIERLEPLQNAYKTDYEIFHLPKKEAYKPDNRLAVNFAKYITDTFNGFFIGIPVKVTSTEDNVNNYVEYLEKYNNQDDKNAEESKMASIFGLSYEMLYTDENSQPCTMYCSPIDAFMIYDDSVLKRPRYFVRLYIDTDNKLHGSISDDSVVRYFSGEEVRWETDEHGEIYEKYHQFDGVPAIELRENEECVGTFEPVLNMINSYNKALSEKANDVDYFADAYLKVLGAALDNEELKQIRDNRIINFPGSDAANLIVEFLEKPNADETQENLIDRLEKLIFNISMVANISDENFGTSSGIALKYKLLSMSNLAKTKERKFTAAYEKRYKLLFSHPMSKVPKDAWMTLNFQFTRNYPANIAEEADIAAKLSGVVSKETQLSVLSVVDNVKKEIEKMEEDSDPLSGLEYALGRTGEDDGEEQKGLLDGETEEA